MEGLGLHFKNFGQGCGWILDEVAGEAAGLGGGVRGQVFGGAFAVDAGEVEAAEVDKGRGFKPGLLGGKEHREVLPVGEGEGGVMSAMGGSVPGLKQEVVQKKGNVEGGVAEVDDLVVD